MKYSTEHKITDPAEVLGRWIRNHSKILEDPWPDFSSCDPEILSFDNHSLQNANEGIILDPTFDREDEEDSTWKGRYDDEDNLFGYGTLRLYDDDTFQGSYTSGGIRNGLGIVTSPSNNIRFLTGNWVDGYLEGKIRLVTDDTSVLEGWCVRGQLTGPARRIVMKKFKTFRQQVSWFGRYKAGLPHGQCWEWREGGGYLTGIVDETGNMTGDNIAFIYPDLQTALVGTFKAGVMVEAAAATITDVQIKDDIPVPSFRRHSTQLVGYSKSTKTSVGDQPLVEDPYEIRTCQVRTSEVEGGGEGLYARRLIQAGDIVAFYNGVRLPYKPGEKEDWDTSGYKIFVNADYKSGERIDLPGDLIYTENYRATLGHKMNHSFEPNCTEWFVEHPRHGLVPCAVARVEVEEGEELFLHYGYDPLNCPSWYGSALESYLALHPELTVSEVADPERLKGDK